MNLFSLVIDKIEKMTINALTNIKLTNKLDFSELIDENFKINFEIPKEEKNGDVSTNVALILAKKMKINPYFIAEVLVNTLNEDMKNNNNTYVEKIEAASPGFINFYLDISFAYRVFNLIENTDYGRVNIGNNKSVIVEFASANPTGPIHVGNMRGAALGDAISSILSFSGYRVTKEYYINDAGNQIKNYALSLEARYFEFLGHKYNFPENGYMGDEVIDRVKEFIEIYGDSFVIKSVNERRKKLLEYALNKNINDIRKTLLKYRVEYDSWFKESSLYSSGDVLSVIKELDEKGFVYKKDEALFIKSSEHGGIKDEVIVRANGLATYLTPDLAYHKNKLLNRNFDLCINIFGTDHHGYLARLKSGMKMLGFDDSRIKVVLMQLVRLVSNGEALKMSKRSGKSLTLEDLIEEIDVNSMRFLFISKHPNSHMDFDIDLAKKTNEDNPVYYVEYAHARMCGILRVLSKKNIVPKPASGIDFSLLKSDLEKKLIKHLAFLPTIIENAAINLDPSKVVKYLIDLTGFFHSFYKNSKVDIEEIGLRDARLKLVESTKCVIKKLLDMLKIDCPEKM